MLFITRELVSFIAFPHNWKNVCLSVTMFLFFRRKDKQDTYEVLEKEDSFYKKGKIGKSQDKKQKHLEHRLRKL